ncbi:unnamed protein product [Spirodela intermedia]|uniref:E2F/DP family winged-helix DNA-binding domain-containing protein n=1 Tax=Spirodela intermedia TaxID=51605 RepID=A0A7I8JJT7_SPIIN|nr:unnamed protein product [Spirodela intermedia]CAA6670045.1 unnamed protein product [Spirodela intermedia]
MEPESRGSKYSRKEKSLGLLCTNFMNLYDTNGVDLVCLDDAAGRLGVERRRIYDIVNVLESVGVLARKGKNRYTWIGLCGIPQALKNLKEEAMKETNGNRLPKPAPLVEVNPFLSEWFVKYPDDEAEEDLSPRITGFGEDRTSHNSSIALGSVYSEGGSGMENRREKSLGLFTQNFVKLFLVTDATVISLDEAAKLLFCDGYSSQIRNNVAKVRRLYDIANVLSSLSLIEKAHDSESRKPAFRWLGFNGKLQNAVTEAPGETSRQLSRRTFGSDITNIDTKKKKPTAVQRKSNVIKERNLTVQRQLQTPPSYVFGPFCPVRVDKKDKDPETLTTSFHPHYHNQALSDLFAHYVEAWSHGILRLLTELAIFQRSYELQMTK